MEHAAPHRAIHRLIGLGGGVAFVGSLVFFAASYGWFFDIPRRQPGGSATAILVDLVLFTGFALHHSIFARGPFKVWIRNHVPPPLERSLYVWISSILFILTCAYWQPVSGTTWHVTGATASAMTIGQLLGGLWCVLCARRLDAFALAGLKQAFGVVPPAGPQHLDTKGSYAFVRHPIYTGWLLIVWLAPWMNGARLVFAAVSTFYLVMAVPLEERELVKQFGSAYENYQRRTRWRIVPGLY
jgi:protein-S-isoprenylcysteine O-methyltransferase Ste14